MSSGETCCKAIPFCPTAAKTTSMSAFNPAGEGPESETVTARTLQGLPGPPANLTFSEITMNSLKVSWDKPIKPNGEILGYLVSYETAKQEESKS